MIATKKTIQPKKEKIKDLQDLITVILLCDSPGYRMKSYGPMPLIHIQNKKLIDLQIKAIQNAFINYEIVLCVGFDAEKICKYVRNTHGAINLRVVENQQFYQSNSCESARIAINNTMNNKIVICDGNLLITSKTLRLLDHMSTCVLVEKESSENLDVGVNIHNGEAQHFSFGAQTTWSEILYLHNIANIEEFRRIISFQESKTRFIFEALNEMIKNKNHIKCIHNKYTLQKISNIKTYHAIKGKI